MAKRGPGKKPTHLKSIAGTDQPCRRPEENSIQFDPLDEMPDPPDWLEGSGALQEWNRLGPILLANKILSDAGISVFAHFCNLHGKLRRLWQAGELPNAAVLTQYRALANDFGLTPASQSKILIGDERKPGNKFGNNGRRKQA